IEQTLTERLPWLAQHPRIRRPVAGLLGRLAAESGFNKALSAVGESKGFDFVERSLTNQRVTHRVTPPELEHVPVDGPLLGVANHPSGMLDALALLHLIVSVRREVRVLGKDVLGMLPQLGELLLPVDVFGSGATSRMRGVFRALDAGNALVMFPSGEVSRMLP